MSKTQTKAKSSSCHQSGGIDDGNCLSDTDVNETLAEKSQTLKQTLPNLLQSMDAFTWDILNPLDQNERKKQDKTQ